MNESKIQNQTIPDDTTTSFACLLDVVSYLKGAGYKTSRSTIYRHFSEGKLRCKGGVFTVRDVRHYAQIFLNRIHGKSTNILASETARARRTAADARRSEAHADLLTMKANILAGSYVPKAEFEHALAMRATIFRNDLTNWVHSVAPYIVRLVCGDEKLIPDLIRHMLDKVDDFLNRYADDREYEIVLTGPTPEDLLNEEDDPDKEEGLEIL